MIKADRDQVMSSMSQEERAQYRNILREVRAEARVSSGNKITPKATPMQVWKSRASQYSPQIQEVVNAVFLRDEMGPNEGDAPPDFELKRSGSQERIRLSNFKGQRAVAMAFGSYT